MSEAFQLAVVILMTVGVSITGCSFVLMCCATCSGRRSSVTRAAMPSVVWWGGRAYALVYRFEEVPGLDGPQWYGDDDVVENEADFNPGWTYIPEAHVLRNLRRLKDDSTPT